LKYLNSWIEKFNKTYRLYWYFSRLIVVITFFTFFVSAGWAGWDIQTVDSAGGMGYFTSIALDSSGNPHISYYDSTNSALKYAKWIGSIWEIQTVDSDGYVGYYSSIALDSLGNPHISYLDLTNRNLKYAKWTGTGWSIQTVDSVVTDGIVGADRTSIAIDRSGNPHISYHYHHGYSSKTNYLKYAKWTGTEWSIQTVDYFGGSSDSSIAIDSLGNPHISYSNLKYAKWTGTSWSTHTVDSTMSVPTPKSIALDSSNNPHISYYYSKNDTLKYTKWNGNKWYTQTIYSADGVVHFNSIALDSSGNPHISYYDGRNDALKYAKCAGSEWIIETVDSIGDVGSHTSIALDSSNNSHISYFDYTNSDLKYAKWIPDEPLKDQSPPTVSISVSPKEVKEGEEITVTITGTDDKDLSAIWWWGENTGDTELDKEQWYSCSGTSATKTWTVSTAGLAPGTYTLGANARDAAYPVEGEPHQASEGEGIAYATFTVSDVAHHFNIFGIPDPITAGTLANVTVEILDVNNIRVTNSTTTIHFTSNDYTAILLEDYTFTSIDEGIHTFTDAVVLKKSGEKWVKVTDVINSNIYGSQVDITVKNAEASCIYVWDVWDQCYRGAPAMDVTVGVYDKYWNSVRNPPYLGTITFVSDDSAATLPDNYTFTAEDKGEHTFHNAVVMKTAGERYVKVTDINDNNLTGQQSNITVLPSRFLDTGQEIGNYNTYAVDLGDIDNDGDLDMICGNGCHGYFYSKVYINNGTGAFTDSGQEIGPTNHGLHYKPALSLGDVDNDGDLDLVILDNTLTHYYGGGPKLDPDIYDILRVKVFINDGKGNFTLYVSNSAELLTPGNDVVLCDIDNDGNLDLIAAQMGGFFRVFINDGTGVYTYSEQDIGSESGAGESLAVGDVDNDGDIDVIVEGGYGKGTRVYLNDGEGIFSDSTQRLGPSRYNASCMLLGDIDNDGDLDLAINDYPTEIYINDGAGIFSLKETLGDVSGGGCKLRFGDVDNDGDLDIVKLGTDYGKYRVYLNDGTGSFTDSGDIFGTPGVQDITLGDIDNDGDLDLVEVRATDRLFSDDIRVNRVYINDKEDGNPNNPPSPPTSFSSNYSAGQLTFSWSAGADIETPVSGLYYNIRVSTFPGSNNVISGVSGNYCGLQRKSITLNLLSDNTYYWSVQTIDSGFRKSAWSVEQIHIPLLQDQFPPTVSISITPKEINEEKEIKVTVTGTDDINLSAIWWWGENTGDTALDKAHWYSCSGTWATKTWTVSTAGLAPGTYKLGANSRDAAYPIAGEAHQASEGDGIAYATFAVRDITSPQISITNPEEGAILQGKITVKSDAIDNCEVEKVEFFLDFSTTSIYTSIALSYEWEWDTSFLENGEHIIKAVAYDATGNSASDSIKVNVENDKTPPILSDVTSGNITGISVLVSWKTDESATDKVEYGTSTFYNYLNPISTTLVTVHEVNLIDLLPNTFYYFKVKSEDKYGNLAISDDYTFKTLDTIPPEPVTSLTATATGTGDSIALSWSSSPSDDVVQYKIYRSTDKLEHQIIKVSTCCLFYDIEVVEGENYQYTVTAVDEADNEFTGVSVEITPNIAPAKVEGLKIESVPEGNILKLSWTANTEEDLTGYRIYRSTDNKNYWLVKVLASPSYLDTGLDNGTTYYYQIAAFDEVLNESEKSEVVSGIPQDTLTPKPPSNLVAEINSHRQVKLNWNASPSKDIAKYNVYYDSSNGTIDYSNPIAVVNHPTLIWLSSMLNRGKIYKFGIRAVDYSNNEEKNIDVIASATISSVELCWGDDGIPICQANRNQVYPKITTDDLGDSIITWNDMRNVKGESNFNAEVYAQKLNIEGKLLWRADGVLVGTNVDDYDEPNIKSAKNGEAVISWHAGGNVQYIDNSGIIQWNKKGLNVGCAMRHTRLQANDFPCLIVDMYGQIFVTWSEMFTPPGANFYSYIWCQKLDRTEKELWNGDKIVCSRQNLNLGSDMRGFCQAISDARGGLIMGWEDGRKNYKNIDIYAQRLDSTGKVVWVSGGISICTASQNQILPQIVEDGTGGAIIVWVDYRNNNWDIYAQRIDMHGNILWKKDGIGVCVKDGDQGSNFHLVRGFSVVPDSSGGAIITWIHNNEICAQRIISDNSNGTTIALSEDYDIYAQRIAGNGIVQWEEGGIPVCTANENQERPSITTDGNGGAIICWQDERRKLKYSFQYIYDIYAQHITKEGKVKWGKDGIPVCAALDVQIKPMISYDGFGGAIITWEDQRNGNWDIYAQRITDMEEVSKTEKNTDKQLNSMASAFIKVPKDGKKIRGNAVTVMAETTENTSSVLFQYKTANNDEWINITGIDEKFPYAVYWNVSALENGEYDIRAVAYDENSLPDIFAEAITVFVDDVNADIVEDGNPEVDPNNEHRKRVKIEKDNNVINEVIVADGTSASIPGNSLEESTTLEITLLRPESVTHILPPPASALKPAGVFRKYELASGQRYFSEEINLNLPYPDENEDGIVDGTDIREDELRVFYFVEGIKQWKEIKESEVITQRVQIRALSRKFSARNIGNCVSVKVNHFTIFALMAYRSASTLSNVAIYPNPLKPDRGNDITFDNLTDEAKIRIYTITGRLIRKLEVTPADNYQKVWDTRNGDGYEVASGVYIYFITSSGKGEARGKLAIIR